ncbi:flavin reductase family protein [Croceibacterium aestuarii]|uniref:flavin reductase family protein n=1 Tax=Croceibacterium aestuarii TaxID=3064139 RepID=UPI00272DE380|nr:flavin reductase family protein [Croceibacterium sp. D39]
MTDSPQPEADLLESFRAAMRHVAATVYAVTTGSVGERHGILATAVSSLSFEPPSLLVCINRAASLHEPLACAETFCVNVLGMANRDVADAFVSSRGEERFVVGEWAEMHGVPVLQSAQSSFVCRTAHRHEFGTHTIFIGELLACHHRADARPLTYYDRRYIDLDATPAED